MVQQRFMYQVQICGGDVLECGETCVHKTTVLTVVKGGTSTSTCISIGEKALITFCSSGCVGWIYLYLFCLSFIVLSSNVTTVSV